MVRIKVKKPKKSSFLGERRSALHLQRRGACCIERMGIFARRDRRGADSLERRGATRETLEDDFSDLGIKRRLVYTTKGGLGFLQKRRQSTRKTKTFRIDFISSFFCKDFMMYSDSCRFEFFINMN